MFDPITITFLILGALAGGFINGLAGFGTSLFALGFWLQVLPPVQAVAVSLVVSVFTGLPGCWEVRREIRENIHLLNRFALPGVGFITVGVLTLAYVEPRTLKLLIAGFLILYAGFFIVRRSLPAYERPARYIDIAIGAAGGFLGGLAGLSGALPAMWLALRPWPRQKTRSILQPYNVIILGLSAILLAAQGAYAGSTQTALLIVLPLALVGSQIGLLTFRRISDTGFRWLLIGLMLASGIILAIRELL